MASRFKTFLEEKKALVETNTKKATSFGLPVFEVENYFHAEFATKS